MECSYWTIIIITILIITIILSPIVSITDPLSLGKAVSASSCFSGHYLGNLCYSFDTFTISKLGGGEVNLTSCSYLFIL